MNITRYEQQGAFLPEASACRTFRPKSGEVPHLPIRHPRNSLSLNPLLPSFAGIRKLHLQQFVRRRKRFLSEIKQF